MNEKLTLNLQEAANLIGCSRPHCFKMIKQNKIPGVIRLGRRLLISRKSLEDWLNNAGKTANAG